VRVRRLRFQPLAYFARFHGPGEQVSLAVLAAQLLDIVQLMFQFHTLCDNLKVQAVGKRDDRKDDLAVSPVRDDACAMWCVDEGCGSPVDGRGSKALLEGWRALVNSWFCLL